MISNWGPSEVVDRLNEIVWLSAMLFLHLRSLPFELYVAQRENEFRVNEAIMDQLVVSP